MTKKAILIITDGIGSKPPSDFNAFLNANKPTYDELFSSLPNSLLKSYGVSVGLPDGQMGNSEVGHMTIGSGRVIYQDLVRINMAIEDGSLNENDGLNALIDKSKRVHIFGLVSDGGVHSHYLHIAQLVRHAARSKEVFLHIATDGRDVSPVSAASHIENLQKELKDVPYTIATISGRFYSMDRDNRWERVKQAYDAIVDAKSRTDLDIFDYIKASYEQDVTDEFIAPASFANYDGVQDGDGFIMANFRSDRARQISAILGSKDFMPIEVHKKDISLITMTPYSEDFTFDVIFKKDGLENVLAQVLSDHNLRQFHTAETEKYAHVTFFLNGGVEEPFVGETRLLVPSPKVKTYDLQPQMSAYEVTNGVLKAMDDEYDFIVVNFANGDMVGHTGVYEAALKAVETVDECVGKIVKKAYTSDYSFLLTSDHGNCEQMRDEQGNILTNHTVGEVYCFVYAKGVTSIKDGALNHIAPTILKMMNIPIPEQMDEPLF